MRKQIESFKNNMSRVVRYGALHIFTGSFLTKVVTFFGSIVIVRLLSKTDYGILSYMENLYGFAYVVAGMGLLNAILRYVVLEDSIEGKKGVFDYATNKAFIYNIVLVGAVYVLNTFYPHAAEFADARKLIYIMFLMLPFQYYVTNNLSLERAMFSNKRYALLAFLTSAAFVCSKFAGALINGISGVVVTEVAVYAGMGIAFYFATKKKYFQNVVKTPLDKKQKREIDKYSLQYMVTNGIWTLFMLLDVFLLGRLLTDAAMIADYKVAYVWPANISILCSSIGIFVAPYFVKHENDRSWVRVNYKRTLLYTFLIVLFAGAVVFALAKPLVFIYAGTRYYNVIPVLRLITIAAVINNGLRFTTANVFAAMGQIRFNMIVSMVGIAAQFILDLIFIPRYGIYGPPCASIITYSIMSVVLFWSFNRKYGIIGRHEN